MNTQSTMNPRTHEFLLRLVGLIGAAICSLTLGPAHAALDRGTADFFQPGGVPCPAPPASCTSGVTTVQMIDNGDPNTIEFSILTSITTPDGADLNAPSLRLDFGFEGWGTNAGEGNITFIEHWTNDGTAPMAIAWEEATQIAAPFHFIPSLWPDVTDFLELAPAGSVAWTTPTSTTPGYGETVTLPGLQLEGAIYNFSPFLMPGEMATIQKELQFLLAPDVPCELPCESGVVQVAVAFAPAALPIPPAIWLFVSAALGLGFIRKRSGLN